jgi:hypothetical protein
MLQIILILSIVIKIITCEEIFKRQIGKNSQIRKSGKLLLFFYFSLWVFDKTMR